MYLQPDDSFLDFDRSEPLSDAEFAALRRTPAGDIIDLAAAHPFLTDEHRLDLTPDDAARVDEWDLEEASLFTDALVEYGIATRVRERFDLWAA